MKNEPWQFRIDVGGTFTDCIACPSNQSDQSLRRYKLLSSSIIPGILETLRGSAFTDNRRSQDPANLWNGVTLQIIGTQGDLVFTSTIIESQSNLLQLADAIPADCLGLRYELLPEREAPVIGIHYLLGIPLAESLPPVTLRLGTTRGTNALLTRTGAKTLFVTTQGFGDILHIGNQDRPDLFALDIQKHQPLFSSVLEVTERMSAAGEIIQPLELNTFSSQLQQARQDGIESVAICLMNAYINDQHEQQLKTIAQQVGFKDVSVSSEIASLIKLVSRADTTVLNSYLNPVLTQYISRITDNLHSDSQVRLITSAGALITAEEFSGKDSILSGPAGGVVGFSQVAKQAGFTRAIGFDMGGTSTDVSRFDGQFEYEFETQKAGVRIVTPMLAVETVAAGGGSICGFDGVKLTVGPQSAGSNPGPACYGRGGPLTVTDLNLVLGRILPEQFSIPLSIDSAVIRLEELNSQIQMATEHRYKIHDLAEALLTIANHNMAQAIGNISVARGYDPADYTLVSFGGAAAQHACQVAQLLGISKILNHPDAGILSAYGMGHAPTARQADLGIYQTLSPNILKSLEQKTTETCHQLGRQVEQEGYPLDQIGVRILAELRPAGVDATLAIPMLDTPLKELVWSISADELTDRFMSAHHRRYGFTVNKELELVTLRIEVTGLNATATGVSERQTSCLISATSTTECFAQGQWQEAGRFERSQLRPGDQIAGPAIVTETISTTVIEPGWTAEVLSGDELLLTCDDCAKKSVEISDDTDPALLEIFNNQFVAIAEQMGLTLQNTSSSVNVKERLDFSCAIFTAAGELVVNAPHIPVHLGAMGESVRAVIEDHEVLQPGDVFITNDPYRGGSHLPDITVITPVFNHLRQRIFFTASRAHHSEIGGITPGSMPPFSQSLAEEGVLIPSLKLVQAGVSKESELRGLLSSGAFPSRSVDANLADINAQIAANQQGANDLQKMIGLYSEQVVLRYMQLIQAAATTKIRQALNALGDGTYEYRDVLDEHGKDELEAQICVSITINGTSATIDFTGTSAVLPINLNANRAIVTAAVLYVLRLLINEPIPLNQGVLEPITIILPACMLNPAPGRTPAESPAVVGGNVETSQRIVDTLIGAFHLAAASQGTMNNLLFGDDSFGYYETICGGAGATENAAGADAVHTHMTNTRITDPEILEQRYPVRLDTFSIRRGSGGAGVHPGGNGIIRAMTFLKPVTVSLLTQRRGKNAPPGMEGGQPGQPGVNRLLKNDGSEIYLKNRQQLTVMPGDQLTLESPGGGGWGTPSS